MIKMDIHEILRKLPHRYPIILVDRVLELHPGERIVALKNVTINEPYFMGHFPGHPVMPGVLIIESMAQAAAILSYVTLQAQEGDDTLFYFAGIDAARFKRPVLPGDQLRLEVEMGRVKRGIGKFTARALVEGQLAAEAEMMCAVRSKSEAA
jgi:3-hydroxyacyl-[acyl-carrier-protein] dehydratase